MHQILDDPRADHRVSGWCPACRLGWSSTVEAHCAGCCRQFASERAFDAHQRLDRLGRVVCRDPVRMRGRLVLSDGRWDLPDTAAPARPPRQASASRAAAPASASRAAAQRVRGTSRRAPRSSRAGR